MANLIINNEAKRKQLIKKFHVLLGKGRINNEGKMEILAAYGTDSSSKLGIAELIEMCNKLERLVNPSAAKAAHNLDLYRKRVMAAIGGYLRAVGKQGGSDVIKAIACRATGYESFNRIPADRLRNLYNAFTKKQKDFAAVEEIHKRITAVTTAFSLN